MKRSNDSVDSKIAAVGLTEKRHTRAASLSGGQKRKLCVAIGLLGSSPVCLLDEPTSGKRLSALCLSFYYSK